MIPDFKTYIKESLWSDLEDRSSGDVVRREDDINLLDLNEFYKYIKDHYKTKVEYIDLDAMGGGNGDVLGVDITEDIILFYKPKRGHILLSWSRVKIPMPFFDELTDRFKIENPNAMRRVITEKDGSCTNKTFVDAIEFFLRHKDSLVNESLWSDLQDRSSGDVVRKEDDVDHFDYEEFFVYLTELYQPKSKKINEKIGGRTSIIDTDIIEIFIPIESIDGRLKTLIIEMSKKDDSVVSIATSPTLFDKYVNLERMLSNNYTFTTSRLSSRIYLRPKGKMTNKFCIDLIDTFLAVVNNPILEKVS